MKQKPQYSSLEQARGSIGKIANSAHLEGRITYLTRNGKSVAAVVPVGSKGSALPDSVIDAAMEAAWPGLPECMTLDEARRRTVAALNAASTHLADLLDKAVGEARQVAEERVWSTFNGDH